MTDLVTDLRILRQMPVRYKYMIITGVAHLYIHHPDAVKGLTEKELKDIIYSEEPIEDLAKIMEKSPDTMKGDTINKKIQRNQRSQPSTYKKPTVKTATRKPP
jgi:hypothetical protein